MEGDTFDETVVVGSGLDGVFIGVGHIGDAKALDVHGGFVIGIFKDVVSFGEEHVDLVIGSGLSLVIKSKVKSFLISTIFGWGFGEDDWDAVDVETGLGGLGICGGH